MGSIMTIACVIFGHQPNLYRRWMDDVGWRTRCTRCRAPMRMDHISGRWPRWATAPDGGDR
jgi:hypothetical protein